MYGLSIQDYGIYLSKYPSASFYKNNSSNNNNSNCTAPS